MPLSRLNVLLNAAKAAKWVSSRCMPCVVPTSGKFSIDLTVPVGIHKVVARCTTASGAQSGEDSAGSSGLVGYDGSMELDFEAV